jgi:hypothetical protein
MKNTQNVLNHLQKAVSNNERIIKYNHSLSGGKRKNKRRIYLTVRTNKRVLFVKYDPETGSNAFIREYNALTKINSDEFVTPQPIILINKGVVTSEIKGTSLEGIIKRKGLKQSLRLLTDAITRIAVFHKKYSHQLKKKDKKEICEEVTGSKMSIEISPAINRASFGFIHGDLDPFNTFYNAKKSEFILIDWEDFRENGIQELDVLHFVTMLGVIANPELSYRKLFRVIFEKNIENPYLDLLARYCKERTSSLTTVFKLIPVYCDAQNHRLIKAHRETRNFLYSELKKNYYEKQYSV